jgi:HEAT repeat protein
MLLQTSRSWIPAYLALATAITSFGCHRYLTPAEIASASTPEAEPGTVTSPTWRRWPGNDQPPPGDPQVPIHKPAADQAAAAEVDSDGDASNVVRRLSDLDPVAREAAIEDLFAITDDDPPPLPIDELRSPDVPVRVAAIAALGQRSDDEARQLLTEQLSDGGERLRQASIESLAAVGDWPAEAAALEESLDEAHRAPIVQQLSAYLTELAPESDEAELSATALDNPLQEIDATDDDIRLVRESLSELDLAPTAFEVEQIHVRLRGLGPVLIPALEEIVRDGAELIRDDVYQRILPSVDEDFADLLDLQSEDIDLRRRASDRISERAAQRPLTWLALGRLAEVCVGEMDAIVWKNILEAIRHDTTQPTVRLAVVALSHPDAEIRVQGCAYFQRHPQPDSPLLLMPSLADQNESVVLAAVRALRDGPSVQAHQPLQQLLAAPNKRLRVEAATTLAAMQSAHGVAALERLSYDEDEAARCMVAAAMGELGDPQFSATLIRLLDDQASVRNAALHSLPQVSGHEIDDDSNPSISVAHWKAWYRDRQE